MECDRDASIDSAPFGPSQTTSHQETTSSNLSPSVVARLKARLEPANQSEKIELPHNQPRLPLKESLGFNGCLIIAGGSIVILATMGFLASLWFGYGYEPEAADATWAWRQIALRDWMARTITISSLLLRFVISLQTSVCTSMIAALVLEKRLTRKSDVAYLSISRGISDGPRRLVLLLFSSGTSSIFFHVEIWLISLMALVALGLQFSSTVLISDLHRFTIVGDVGTQSIRNLCSFSGFDLGDAWTIFTYTPVYTMFGEEKLEYNITPDVKGFSDSGLVRRGYLPLGGVENRTSVRQYRGTTLISSLRTVCVPPQLDGYLRSHITIYANTAFGSITGTVDYGPSLRDAHPGIGPLCTSNGCETVPFECNIPGSLLDHSTQANYCFLETVGRTSQTLQTLALNGLSDLNLPAEPWSLNSSIYLVIRSNLTVFDWSGVPENTTVPPARTIDEWRTFELMEDRFISLSLCFSRFTVEARDARLSASEATLEPTIMWDGLTVQHDTSEVSSFIGAETSAQTFSERGMMSMEILPTQDEKDTSFKPLKELSPGKASSAYLQRFVVKTATSELTPNVSYVGCVFCTNSGEILHNDLNLLFSDVIESSGRAAAALQSVISVLSATIFDGMIKVFNLTEEVSMAVTTTASTPGPCSSHQCSGFISVMVLLVVHLAAVAVITALYVSQVRFSRYSNIWHAVSQLVGEELKDTLEQGNDAKDKDVVEALKRERKDDFVKLEPLGDSSRVEIVKHSDDNRKLVEIEEL
ncbi:hypothetical protein F4820DRAFT_467585 [Hypoxylon rubiginosum]|uniref:Uncharacterized protein n=1 Tax=Hypoxylon rubiginosum TaxID=110542 RepID=A0ACB9YI81_9PEZI|nr:hypothetical protein F4820DRAFT_467585 [Hypoxylon rubiginosum]